MFIIQHEAYFLVNEQSVTIPVFAKRLLLADFLIGFCMALNIKIRESESKDHSGILSLYPLGFPDEDLVPLVKELLAEKATHLSLVADLDGNVIAHVDFSPCSVEDSDAKLSLLGPLCVTPEFHRKGVGTAIVKSGLARLDADQVSSVLVLGAPSYYGRFGFRKSDKIAAPFDLPEIWYDSWQVLNLEKPSSDVRGRLNVTSPWQQEALWLP